MRDILPSYDQIYLRPKKSNLAHRCQADTSVMFLGKKFNLPVVPANMEDVISFENAKWLAENGYFYIMHRFKEVTPKFVDYAIYHKLPIISISVGVDDYSRVLIDMITHKRMMEKIDFITIDVAHAHHENVKSMVNHIRRQRDSEHPKIIAGNVATLEGYKYLYDIGVDAVKIGIGQGCFVPDTLVYTDVGLRKIQDISIGDKVLSHKNTFEEVTSTFSEKRDEEIIKINGKIECTKNHKFYVVNKKYENLVTKDNIDKYAKWIEAENLTDEYFLIEF